MEIKKKTVEVYEVGGKEFIDRKEAEEYEKQLKEVLDYSYYPVTHAPDLTEGRGYYKSMIVAVKPYHSGNVVIHYLCNTFGKPLEFVMGVAPIDNWIVGKKVKFDTISGLAKFMNKEVQEGIGDYRKQVKREVKVINNRGEEIENEFLSSL